MFIKTAVQKIHKHLCILRKTMRPLIEDKNLIALMPINFRDVWLIRSDKPVKTIRSARRMI